MELQPFTIATIAGQHRSPVNTFVSIKGETKKIGGVYPKVKVILISQDSSERWMQISDNEGNYHFRGVGRKQKYHIIAFDPKGQFNAVIQDNVVPK